MKVIKLYIKGKPQLLEFIKEASVQFDPTETPVEWIRDFSLIVG